MNEMITPHPLIIIFDFDGVILSNRGTNLAIFSQMKNPEYKWNYEKLKKFKPVDLVKRFEMADNQGTLRTGYEIYKKFADVLPARLKRVKCLIKMGRIVRETEKKFGDFFPGVTDTLKELHEAGIILGICTNSEGHRVPYWLKRKNCEQYISDFTSRSDKAIYGIKPEPRNLLNLIIRLKRKYKLGSINRDRIYFIGDNPSDIWAGQNARVKSIAVLSGHSNFDELAYIGADYVLNSINDLFSIPEIEKAISSQI
ncbi:MAG: HAD family hydrolase [archaeon]|nr:HAD family hydrolase [archaeon]